MSEIKRVKIDSIIESQIPEFLNEDSPLFVEFLKQYYYSLEHKGASLDIVNNLKKYKDIQSFDSVSLISSTTLTSNILSFDTTINVDSTDGWPDTYGLLKIDDEIITYLSKTPTSFVDCKRGFSGIDQISSIENPQYLNFSITTANEHQNETIVTNLSNLFLVEFFQKFRNEFFPGFENREFADGLELPNILTSAKNFYSSKGTDSSYKLLFKILFNTDVEIIKPQDNTLVPSSNVYFVTKNILVEKISGVGNPLELPGNFLFQTLSGIGTVSASIFNVEYRPVDKKELYEISLDSTSLSGTFQVSGTTKISEDVQIGSDSILVDSTNGFSQQGSFVVKTETSDLITVSYTDKTTTQFLGVTGVDRFFPFNTEIIEEKFANSFVGSGTTSPINFRVINVIDTIDSSKTSNMRVGDTVKLSGFGKDLSQKVQFNNWIYNTPTYHNIQSINKVSVILYRITLYDEVYFYLNENIVVFDENNNTIPASIISIEYPNSTIKKYSNVILVQLDASSYDINKAIGIRRQINKSRHNLNYFPGIEKIPTGVQNTYLNTDGDVMFVTSTGLPNYTISAIDNKSTVTTSGTGKTDVFYSPNHPYVTGETIYYQPYENSGINTGPYQLTKTSKDTFKLSFSKSDVFSKTYIQANSNILSDEIVKFGYENKTIKNQKLIKEISLIPTPLAISDDENKRVTTGENKQLGLLSNGVELYSSTSFDETINYGEITSIEVIDSGFGYDVISAPDLEVTDISGSGAKAKLNIIGNVKQVDIISPGVGYQNKPKITISGGNGSGCVLESNLVSAKIVASFKGDSAVSVASNTITFDEQLLFEDNEEVIYNSNGNIDIGGITNGASYYVGITTDKVIKLYTNIQNSSSKINPINISSISFGIHNLTTLKNKNTISKIYVKNSGEGYSNRSVRIPSILSFNNITGINTFDSYIFAKNHGFKSGEIVKYSYIETPISGLSSQVSYYVDVIDVNKFKLASAGIGATLGKVNLINKRYERLNTLGVGTHIIQYPPIEIGVESVSSIGSTTIITPILKPVVLGSVDSVFLENGGVSYGCTNIINFHRRPLVTIPEVTSEALLKPIIVNGSIVGIQIVNKGRGYRSDATINIESSGKFCELLPTIENGSVASVTVVRGGVGYAATDTRLILQNSGSGLKLLANVNEWKINQVVKLKNIIGDDDGIIYPNKNSNLGLQFVNLYVPRLLRLQVGDNIGQNFTELSSGAIHSPLLGYAYDGNPIYGPYAYSNPLGGQIERMVSGYVLNTNSSLELRPPGFESGYFIDDYEFIGTGSLDEFNGRFCITPEFPDGIYAYFYTVIISTSGGGQNIPSGIAIPSYPYVIGPQFKDVPLKNNFLPKFNQDLYKFDTSLTRNISPYYLNYYNSGYELINLVSNDSKQEFRVESVKSDKIEKTVIFSPGDNYAVGDLVLVDDEDTGGTSASISVSRVSGKPISNFQVIDELITNVDFIINKNTIIAETSSPHGLVNGQPVRITGISTVTSSELEGIKYISVSQKEVELVLDIDDDTITGPSTKIVVRDINGFEPNDFIGIGTEILHITKISKEESSFSVNRILNTGIHTVGIDNVFLLPKKFEFIVDEELSDYIIGNKTIFFNPKEDVGTGVGGTTRVISGLYTSFTRTLPSRSIYLSEGHKFFTGEELIYNCGFGGTSLFVNNVGSGVSFKLENNQKVYAVNFGNNYLGLSTVGFTSTSGIGSQFNSLEFRNLDEFFGVIGVGHSLTTTNPKINGNVKNISVEVTTEANHGLIIGDNIKLNLDIFEEETIKVAYDPVNRKLLAKEILFTNTDVSSIDDTIDISSYDGEIKTGDKVVYIAETPISGLSHYGIYYVIKNSLNKIKLAEYLSDIFPITSFGANDQGIPLLGSPNLPIKHINFNSTGAGTQKIYLVNPPISIFKGNKLKFDLSDPSLLNMNLKFYFDSLLEKPIEIIGQSSTGFAITENGVPGSSDAYVIMDTAIRGTPSIFYYNLVSNNSSELEKIQITPDNTLVGGNHIELLTHSLNGSYKVEVRNNKVFTIRNNKNLTYVEMQSIPNAIKMYDTDSKTTLGPISKLKINFAGRGYKKLPLVTGVQSKRGKNAIIKVDSPNIGRIESFSKIKDGFDYPTDPTLSPQMSTPSVVGIKNILTIKDISVIFGGKGYNSPPTLIVPQNTNIKLQTQNFNGSAGSVESVKILTNSTEMSSPLEILTVRNSNGYDIDFITVSGQLITLELSNQSFIPTSFGGSQSIFPFAIGDSIFIENCRLTPDTKNKSNFNSSSYGFKFFPVVGIDTSNNTITYSMTGISTGDFGVYDNLLNLGIVVNKKDMPIFEMNLTGNVNYFSSEIVNNNKFEARVMENGWDGKLNQLRLGSGVGELEVESKLFGQQSKVNGTIENFTTFVLNSTLGVSRDKVGNIDNSVGILNEFQQRISDNFYYQKFSYAIKGSIPYDKWKESVRSLVHPSGFKEFSDLVIYSDPQQTSYSKDNLKPILLDSSAQINVNIDSEVSMYDKTNFTQVYEEDSLEDGSVEKIYIDDGLVLTSYISNNTNKVLKIDDISDQFNGKSFQTLDNRYLGASDLLLYNRNFIQEEVVGFITATYPGILANVDWDRTITSEKIGLVVDAAAHDLKYESNNKSIEVGLSYWSGVGTSYVAGEEVETISGLEYISQLSKYIINNVGVPTSYNLSTSFSVSNLTYDNITGITTITTTAPHLLTNADYVVLKNIVLSCNSGSGISTAIFPSFGAGVDGNGPLSPKGFSYKVSVTGISTFTVNPGVSTISHTYVSGGTVQKGFINGLQQFDTTLEKDASCNVNYNENCYAEQQSAISNLVGIVTSIVGIGTTSVPSEIILPSLTRGGSVVGLSTFKLKNKGISLFKHTFDSNASTVDIINNKFIIPNHNYQSGQQLIYEYVDSPIGIATTSYVSGITSSIIQVGDLDGTAIFENGYSVAITTSITGISTTLVPAGPNFQQYLSVIGIGTLGIDAEFNVFLNYDVATGVPIGTSIIPNKGGRGYKVGDTVSIAGTFLGGTSPTNDLSFVVSNVTSTSISSESNISYSNVPSFSIIGNGAIFNVQRDVDGFVSNVNVVNGGTGYSSTSIVSIAGTYVGGTSDDIISFSPIELGTKSLPRELYVLKLNDNEFRVAGLSTSVFVDLVGIGSGFHSFAYSNPDPSVLISIDGVVQSALRRKRLQITLSEPISTATTTLLSVSSGISSLRINDIINIDNELVSIKTIGVSSATSIEVSRGYFDSIPGIHTVGAACSVLSGDFKIIGDTIYFTTPPYGKTGLVGLETGSNFGGRVFSRRFDPSQPIDQNIILDDISPSFTGLAATQFNLSSDGQIVQSIYNDVNSSSFINNNPIILINNVLQESGKKYEIEDENENKINFIDGVPKAGKIVRVGITTGFGYQPLLVAAARVTVSASGTISSVILTGSGGGYRQPPVISVASTIGAGASITATVGSSGTITDFTIVNPGSGYTSTSLPIVVIGIPTGYSNIPLTYHPPSTGVGQGAKVTVEVGSGSSIISFKFDDTGVAYRVGDVLVATGITTGPGLRTDILNIIDFTYDNVSGISTITTDIVHNLNIDDNIRISGAAFTCGYDEVGIKTFSYDNITGICTVVTYSPHGLLKTGVPSNQTSDEVFLFNLPFSCDSEHIGVTTTIFPDATSSFGRVFPVLSSVGLNTFTMNAGISTIVHTFIGWPEIGISTFTYTESTGISTATTSSDHGFEVGDKVTLSGLAFTCAAEYVGVTTTIFPDGTSPYGYTLTVTGVTTNTFTFNAGISTIVHNYVSGGITKKVPTSQRVLRFTDESTDNSYDFRVTGLGGTDQFTIVSSASTISHFYVQSGIVSFRSEPFLLTVEEVETDKFSGFYPGQFVLFEDISNQFNGFKRRFTLRSVIDGIPQQISLRTPEGSDLDITNNIFIYLNDVLQVPGESYTFVGSRITFTEAPRPNTFCSIFYYRGSSVDVTEVTPPDTIKIGDVVIINENANDDFDIDQFNRIVKNIVSSDQFDTFTYDDIGISTDPTKVRPLTWSKQKTDRIINGAIFSKSRPSLKSAIRPQATIIKNLAIDDDEIYVDNAYPIFTDIDGLSENLRNITVFEDRQIEPATGQSQVSSASSVSSINIIFSGIGYINDLSPELLVSSSAITQKDPIFNWKSSVGISPSYQLNSIVYGNIFVGVGNTQSLITSPDGQTWQNFTIGLITDFDAKSVITNKNNEEHIYVSVGSNARVVRSIGVGNSISSWTTITLKEEQIIPGIGLVDTINSNYSGTFNEIVYSPSYSTYVTVGTAGSIFAGIGIGTDELISRFSQTLSTLNSVSFSFNSSINSGYFVAVGVNGTILTSSSGQIWDIMASVTTQTLNKVIFAEGRFVIVGNSGTVIKSISQSQYELITTNIGVNLVNIRYAYGIYVASDDSQNLYYSLNLSEWVFRSTNQSNIIKDFIFADQLGIDGTYVAVGGGGTSVYAEPILNRATGIVSVSGGTVTSIDVINGGFGYSPLNPPEIIIKSDTYDTENIFSIKVIGDHGKIIGINTFITGTPGIGTTTPKIEFVLKSETYDNNSLGIGYTSLNVLGVNNSQLAKGDYFVITDSNVTVGHAITGITTSLGGMSNYPASKVGTAVSFIDGVYRVEQVTTPTSGIVTVTCNLAPSSFGNFVQIYKRGLNNSGIGTNNFYGNYSWGKIFDFQNRVLNNPKSFSAFTDNGIVGLSTSPKVIRTRGLLSN